MKKDFNHTCNRCWVCNKLFTEEDIKRSDDLKGYDGQEISNFDVKINVIPNGLEKYMAFKINNNLVFIDRMQLMNSSLYSLVKQLSDNDFKYLSEEFSDEQLKLVKLKGVYPYEYIESPRNLFDEKLTDRYEFYSCLKDEYIIERNYLHAIDAWNTLKRKAMGEYHNNFVKTDVLLLADVFENFINTCL